MSAEASTGRACPKCGREGRAGERACARCGLLVARFGGFAAEQGSGAPALDALWERCASAWDDPSAHDRLLDQATRLGLLPALARRYRERSAGGADPVAAKRLSQIAVLLDHALRAEVREEPPRLQRVVWALGYLAALALLVATGFLLHLALRRHG